MTEDIAVFLSRAPYNVRWLILLVLVAPTSAAAVIFPKFFLDRDHNTLRLTNEWLARQQLGYVGYCLAVLMSGPLGSNQGYLAPASVLLAMFSLVAYALGLLTTKARRQKRLLNADHVCPYDNGDACTKSIHWLTAIRFSFLNVLLFLFSFSWGVVIAFSLKPATDQQEDYVVGYRPQGAPTIRTVPYENQPTWYRNHIVSLQTEGDRLKRTNAMAQKPSIENYALGSAEYTASVTTIPFRIVLSVPKEYTIVSQTAFRATSAPIQDLSLSVLRVIPRGDDREIQTSQTRCKKADKVVILFRVDGKRKGAAIDIVNIVKPRFEY